MVMRWSRVDLRNASTISQKIRPLARSKKSCCNKEHRAKSAEEEEKTGYEATKAKTSEGLENTKENWEIEGERLDDQVASENGSLETRMTRRPDTVVLNY
ncbi:hypothetical protein Tco_1434169 [Tanacetum coccineum]